MEMCGLGLPDFNSVETVSNNALISSTDIEVSELHIHTYTIHLELDLGIGPYMEKTNVIQCLTVVFNLLLVVISMKIYLKIGAG
jgi:ABC-type branched-subunit amino acid transport system ATPase component